LSEATTNEKGIVQTSEAEVMAVVVRRLDGIRNKDESAVRSAIGEGYNKFDDWPPFGRQEAEEALKSEFGAFKVLSNYSYELKDPKTIVFGDVAVRTSVLHYGGEIRNRPFETNSRVTFVLKRRCGVEDCSRALLSVPEDQSIDQIRSMRRRFPW
jgi:ketosteroid isomerase-like protein